MNFVLKININVIICMLTLKTDQLKFDLINILIKKYLLKILTLLILSKKLIKISLKN